MSAPPGVTAVPSRNLPANGATQADDLSPRAVAREAVRVLAARGFDVRPAMVRVLVTRFLRDGGTSTAEVEPYLLHYMDPTGETAVRNVMRGAR